MQMSEQDLLKYISTLEGEYEVSIEVQSPAEMYKKNNPYFGTITKVSKYIGTIGFDYAKLLKDSQPQNTQPETNTQPKTLPWGTHYNKYVIEHNGNFYLQLHVSKHETPTYVLNGSTSQIPYETIKTFLKTSNPPANPNLIIRTIKFANMQNYSDKNITSEIVHTISVNSPDNSK